MSDLQRERRAPGQVPPRPAEEVKVRAREECPAGRGGNPIEEEVPRRDPVDQKTSFHSDLDFSWSARELAMVSRIRLRE
jgi:hypothetical protein